MTREDEIKAAILHCFKGPEYEVECCKGRYRFNGGWEILHAADDEWCPVCPGWMNCTHTGKIALINPPPKKQTHAEWVKENLPYDMEDLSSYEQQKFFTDLLERATGEK